MLIIGGIALINSDGLLSRRSARSVEPALESSRVETQSAG
jgi:hypothetical protein